MKIIFGMHVEWERVIRSFAKSITFRISCVISDTLVVLFITKAQAETISIVLFTNLASTLLYFIHERIWSRIPFWKIKEGDVTTHFDHHYRSIVKSITYRLIIIFSDFAIATFITGNSRSAFHIILFTNISSTILYYAHERIWNRITWAKKVVPVKKVNQIESI